MIVKVIDRAMQAKLWGNGYTSISQVIKTIRISDKCPICGGDRGQPRLHSFVEDGESYSVHKWKNPCGHVDMYEDCIKEAEVFNQCTFCDNTEDLKLLKNSPICPTCIEDMKEVEI